MMKAAPIKFDTIMFRGGLDLITPTLNLKPGVCSNAINFECATTGGYTRIKGFERLDGRPAPSAAQYLILTVSGTTIPTLGSTITGGTSGATGVLVAQTAATFVLTKVTGTFNGTELLQVSGITVATQTGFTGASTQQQVAQYLAAAADNYRADIAKPAGSGGILGAFCYKDVKYCFRNNAGGTAAVMFKATASGWQAITFGYEIAFTAGGNVAPAEGSTLTQGGVTATINRVVLQSGAWVGAPGTAAGRLIMNAAPAGGNFTSGAATLTGGVNVTITAVQTAITLLPNGKYDIEETNFAGSAKTTRIYGCDGVNRGFEWDGTTFVPIATGTATDTPTYVAAHKKHLFWAFGSSVIHSAPGLPYDYTALSGASEIATGDVVTGMTVQPGAQTTAAMAIYNLTNTLMLYGTGVSSWNLVAFNTGTGAYPWSTQNMSQSYVLDNRGVVGMQPTLDYGNFDQTTLTANIQPLIVRLRSLTTASVLCREKSQYRLYFSNGMALYLTIVNGTYMGAMPMFLPITGGVNNAWEGSLSTGDEIILLCGADGYVYQADKGTSFDGAAIQASITLHYGAAGSPRLSKRYRKCAVEMLGTSYAEVDFNYSLAYGSNLVAQPNPATYSSNMLNSNWDVSTWDQFFWDASGLQPVECEMAGTGENVALTFTSTGTYFDVFTLNSAVLHYSPRRTLR